MNEIIVAFTGPRPQKLGGFDNETNLSKPIKAKLKQVLEEIKPVKTISGLAQGIDSWAIDVCLELSIPYIGACPFLGQEKVWPKESQERYHKYLKLAEKVVIVSEGGYAGYKMQVRNEWMVDNCDLLIAVWDGTMGGTGNCVNYAKSKNKKMIIINPLEVK
jgi:uncharacterized phage-like protein YoqJ